MTQREIDFFAGEALRSFFSEKIPFSYKSSVLSDSAIEYNIMKIGITSNENVSYDWHRSTDNEQFSMMFYRSFLKSPFSYQR